jgi:hypothetical protein
VLINEPPLLILGFNRPEFIKKVFRALEFSKPRRILFAVDGPRENLPSENLKVLEVQNSIELIKWNSEIHTRFRSQNLGLKNSVVDAVSWAISTFGRVIVLEDDAVPGPQFLNYMTKSLDVFEKDSRVGHVSGYNCVPPGVITKDSESIRLSKYPESYAWGTWERAWNFYDDEISLKNLGDLIPSRISQLTWKEYFYQAQNGLISTWAFRWIHALWTNNLICISPNTNLVKYIGHENGTHTRSKPRYKELDVEVLKHVKILELPHLDISADNWLKKNVFRETLLGLIDLKIKTFALKGIKLVRKLINHSN